MKTYRWLIAGSLAGATSGFAGACSSSSDGGNATGGSGNRGGSSGKGGSGGSGNTSGTNLGGSSTGGSVATGGTSGPGGAGGEGGEDSERCATDTQVAELTPANLLFVIDKSGSMNCNPPEGDPAKNARCANFPVQEDPNVDSKWEVTRDALANALDSLAGQTNVSVGLMLFPVPERAPSSASPAAAECYVDGVADVEVGQLDTQARDDLGMVLDAVTPLGETPIVGATMNGYNYLSEGIRAGEVEGNHFVVLLTDGAETCARGLLSELVNVHVPNARGDWNIRTFVIGVPGSEQARSLLSDIAWEGGTATSTTCSHGSRQADEGDCHFDMTESADLAADLNAALQEISRTRILSCDYAIPENPTGGDVDLGKVNITFTPGNGDPERILQDTTGDCDAVDGWRYNDAKTRILLCGDVCDRVQADPEGQVSIVLGCITDVVR